MFGCFVFSSQAYTGGEEPGLAEHSSTCFEEPQLGWWGCTLHPLTHVRKHVLLEMLVAEAFWQLPITSPKATAPPCRNTSNSEHKATSEISLKMALFVEVCPNPAPQLRRKCDCGNFLAQFASSQLTKYIPENSLLGAMPRSNFLYDDSVSWHISISSSSTGDCWGRAASITGWLKGNFLFGWLHRRTQMGCRVGRSAPTTTFPE